MHIEDVWTRDNLWIKEQLRYIHLNYIANRSAKYGHGAGEPLQTIKLFP